MKLNFEIEIDAGLDDVWTAFTNPDNMRRWVQNFESFTPKSGIPGQPGATAEVAFNENGKRVVMLETITERRDPNFLAGSYETDHGKTVIVNHFEAIDESHTRWTSWCRFTMTGFLRLMSLFVGRIVRKRTEGDMQRFKLMVESDLAGTGP
ncbi:MAG: SRPBCC family protein [Gammaproteobacteria bacterium]|nr:SRPBCC family protein [Gammaproteobacteria bacterium]